MKKIIPKLMAGALILLLVFYFGYQIFSLGGPSVETQTVYEFSTQIKTSGQAVIFREEASYPLNYSGSLLFTVSDGDKVGNGSVIAKVYQNDDDAVNATAVENLSEEIELLDEIRLPSLSGVTSIESINRQIYSEIVDIKDAAEGSVLLDIDYNYDNLITLLYQKSISVNQNVNYLDTLIADLRGERDSLSATISPPDNIYTNSGGYFVSFTDGLEEYLSIENGFALTPAQIDEISKQEIEIDFENYKLATSYENYFAVLVDAVQAEIFEGRNSVTISYDALIADSIKADIISINYYDDEQAVMILKTINTSESVFTNRTVNVEIFKNEVSGLRVPITALRIIDDVFGVYIVQNNKLTFKKVDIIYEDESYFIAEMQSDSDYLLLFDEVVVGGTDLYEGKQV